MARRAAQSVVYIFICCVLLLLRSCLFSFGFVSMKALACGWCEKEREWWVQCDFLPFLCCKNEKLFWAKQGTLLGGEGVLKRPIRSHSIVPVELQTLINFMQYQLDLTYCCWIANIVFAFQVSTTWTSSWWGRGLPCPTCERRSVVLTSWWRDATGSAFIRATIGGSVLSFWRDGRSETS
jgi:hypothetical protein